MPRIFDNIALDLLPALMETLEISQRSDFCVGYFNLRGWKAIDALVEKWVGGAGQQCRLLVGMQRLPQDELRKAYSLLPQEDQISNQAVIRLKRRLAEEFRAQLTIGAPTDDDEAGLRRLSAQLKAGKVVVKPHLRHTLHAKLYLCFRADPNNPITGFLGSSNLTLSGLSKQGELNVDGGAKPDSGVMVYVRTADGNDALAWVDEQGCTVTESQHEILRAAACEPDAPALPRLAAHHALVQQAVTGIQKEHATTGGQLGKPASARRRVYERLKHYAAQVKDSLFDIKPLHQAIDAIYETPLTEAARDLLNREMKCGIDVEKLVEPVLSLHEEDRLCVPQDDVEAREPKIICSLGIRKD